MATNKPKVARLLIAVGLLGLLAFLFSQREPKYNGKTAQEWMAMLHQPHMDHHDFKAISVERLSGAEEQAMKRTFAQFGTNMLSVIIEEATALPSRVERGLRFFPYDVTSHIHYTPANVRNDRAWRAFEIVASSNGPATASWLMQQIPSETNIRRKGWMIGALGICHGAFESVFPVLMAKAKDPDPDIRVAAISSLGALQTNAEQVIRPLTLALDDKSPYVRMATAYALGTLGAKAKAAIPALRSVATNDVDADVRTSAEEALAAVEHALTISPASE